MLRIAAGFGLLLGPAIVLLGIHGNYRDRPSLQWPKVRGTMIQSESDYHGGKNSYYDVSVTYRYFVGDDRYIGHQVSLWNPNLKGDGDRAKSFVAAHAVHSFVDVYYDPQHPEHAVIILGADESGNRFYMWDGSICFVVGLYAWIRSRKMLAKIAGDKRVAKTGDHHSKENIRGLPQAFVSYEPEDKRKLNCFPNERCLLEVLGQKGKKLQDWKPADRVIDSVGREYRLVKRPDKDCYDIEPTGETWSCEKLLTVAEADARLIKKDPDALRRQVDDAPAEKKMAVLMKSIDDLSNGMSLKGRMFMTGFVLFLILFFITVVFVADKIIVWFQK